DETLELALAEARELVPEAEVVAVSAKTGAGLDELRAALAGAAEAAKRPERAGGTRLYIDRAFTLTGIGTVVTGTLWSGSIAPGDELRVEPSGLRTRARTVQVHDVDVLRAEAGQRVAVNLPGIERTRLRRGDALVAPGHYPVSWRLDVALAALEEHGRFSPPELAGGLATLEQAGDWYFAPEWLEGVRAVVRERLARRAEESPLDPGLPLAELLPPEPWAQAIVPLLHVERRNAKAYLPGAAPKLGEKATAAAELEAQLAG